MSSSLRMRKPLRRKRKDAGSTRGADAGDRAVMIRPESADLFARQHGGTWKRIGVADFPMLAISLCRDARAKDPHTVIFAINRGRGDYTIERFSKVVAGAAIALALLVIWARLWIVSPDLKTAVCSLNPCFANPVSQMEKL